jgi:pyruvate dehydrogenase (quinone)
MTRTVGDHLLEGVHAWGVDRVFGYTGAGINGINGIVGAFDRMGGADRPRVVGGRAQVGYIAL